MRCVTLSHAQRMEQVGRQNNRVKPGIARERNPDTQVASTWLCNDNSGIFMSYWYGGLYSVIEGSKELALRDEEIDALLKSRNIDLLPLEMAPSIIKRNGSMKESPC
jgi:hypothetical protein